MSKIEAKLQIEKNDYFYKVNLFFHSFGKRIIAGFLLVLFIFIQAEKVLHTHDKTVLTSDHKTVSLKSIANICSICDFKLSKDSELPTLSNTEIAYIFLPKRQIFYHTATICPLSSEIANRGPPVI